MVRSAGPLLVTANDYALGVYNGDTGVVVARRRAGCGPSIARRRRLLELATGPARRDVETMHAMTIHKSQGSQADEVTVLLPDEDSRLLTRELFYTAVTRAQRQVRVVGSRGGGAGGGRRGGPSAPPGCGQRLARDSGRETCRVHRRADSLGRMPYLLRVELPDVPGSLGRVATRDR